MPDTTIGKLNELFDNFAHVLKYIVIFILYVFAFNYMYINNTVPISFILLLFLHISILGLVRSDLRFFKERYNYSIFGNNMWTLPGVLIFIGPFICWCMVFITISFIISMFSRLNFYSNVGEKVDLGDTSTFELSVVKILIILSSVIFAILYGFVYIGLLNGDLHKGVITFLDLRDVSTLIPRLIITTILLFSFVVYFLLTNASNITMGLGISFIICLYFFNFFYEQIKGKIIYRLLEVVSVLSVFVIFGWLIYICCVNSIDNFNFYVLIPYFVWLFYILYMIKPRTNNINNGKSDKSNIYLYSLFVVILYVISGLSLYYGAIVKNIIVSK